MSPFETMYKELCEAEISVRLELNTARELFMKPTEDVKNWLQGVSDVQKRVKDVERSHKRKSALFKNKKKKARFQELLTQDVDHLLTKYEFKNELVVRDSDSSPTPTAVGVSALKSLNNIWANGLIVADRSQLWPAPTVVGTSALRTFDLIWANLMNPKVGVIGVCGLAGIGKTTIMMNIKNSLITTRLFEKVIWVTVSKELNLAEMQNDIALQLNMDANINEGDGVEHQAAGLFGMLTKTKKFVIIFDDLWEEFSMLEVGIPQPSEKNKYKIVVISRSLDICRRMGAKRIVTVEVLSPKEARELFTNKAGNITLTLDIEPFARRVVDRCRGVPIIITSVGLSLRNEVSVKVWRKALPRSSGAENDIVLDLLKYCYNRLRNENLQNCFLYCACFPEDYLFKPEELIRYWIAEGFIHVKGDISAEIDEGFKILTLLLDANMLEIFTKNGDDWLIMHDLFRDLAIKVMKEEPRFWFKECISQNSQSGVIRKISLMRCKITNLDILLTSCEQVSSLLLHQNPISHIHPSFFIPMLGLKFLDISYSLITHLPPSLSDLVQLRSLFLHYCTSLKRIPSVAKMKRLQLLSLCGTAIVELPEGIRELVNLKSLDLSETTNLENMEVGVISSFTRLEELRMQGSGLYKMDSSMVANYLMEMKCLKHLAILTISTVGYANLLGTILHLKQHNLKTYFINLYGCAEDYNEDVETIE